jgi:hypothetical protein
VVPCPAETSSTGEAAAAAMAWLRRRRPTDVQCIGDERDMIGRHAAMMVELQVRCKNIVKSDSVRELFRREACDFTTAGLSEVANTLCTRVAEIIEQRGGQTVAFKVGITTDPVHRMFNPDFGYYRAGLLYDRMDVLAASFPAVCVFFERHLIERFKGRPGCQNEAPGGESAPASGLCYLYVVSEPVGDGAPRRYKRPRTQ